MSVCNLETKQVFTQAKARAGFRKNGGATEAIKNFSCQVYQGRLSRSRIDWQGEVGNTRLLRRVDK